MQEQITEKCNFCHSIFWDKNALKNHIDNVKYCKKYKYIVFTCTLCNYSTCNIKNIEEHSKYCNSTSLELENPIEKLKNKINTLEQENNNYKHTKDQKIKELELKLKLETLKTNLYKNIIENNTSIKLSDVFMEKDDGIHIYDINCENIPIFIHSDKNFKIYEKNGEKTSAKKGDKTSDKKNKHKTTYRSIKSCLDLNSEEDKTNMIKNIDENIQNKIDTFGDPDVLYNNFETCFSKLKQSRVYKNLFEELKKYRIHIFGHLSINSYIELLKSHIIKISDIFHEKNYNEKKITSIIDKSLSSLESRLLRYDGYIAKTIEVEEIELLDTVIDIQETPSNKEYTVFDINKVSLSFHNYSSVLFSLSKNIKKFFLNKYGFNNLIFLPLPKNVIDDPYSFYYLENITNEKRYWKMDCRLEEISINLISKILPYMVGLFRMIYYDVFEDNEFRKNYSNTCQITEFDCEQLLQNIIFLSQPKKFCNLLRQIIKENSTYTPTEKDKFNLYGDDSLQRKRFQEKEDTDIIEIIKQLFDGISSEDAVDFYRSKKVSFSF